MTTDRELVEMAALARAGAYCPYSGFAVGAALLCADGRVFTGCNIENAAFTPGNCAERTAMFNAVSAGARDFSAVAVVGGRAGESGGGICAPCGVCRQVLREFCDPKIFRVILAPPGEPDGMRVFTLEQLLPCSFGPDDLARRAGGDDPA